MQSDEWVVQLEELGVWLAPIAGDPGRTIILASATRFHSQHKAETALRKARKFRPFAQAEVKRMY